MSATVQSTISTGVSTTSGDADAGSDSYTEASFEAEIAVYLGAIEGTDDGLGVELIADASAFGTDTLAAIDIDALVSDGTYVNSIEAFAAALAAAQAGVDDAFASATAIIGLVGGADVALSISVSSTTTSVAGGEMTTMSQTQATIYALQFVSDDYTEPSDPTDDAALSEPEAVDSDPLAEPQDCGCNGSEGDGGIAQLDGNLAYFDIAAVASGDNTLVDVIADAIAVEDQFSSATAIVLVVID